MGSVLKDQSRPREDSEMSQYWQSHSKRNKIKSCIKIREKRGNEIRINKIFIL